ncbi:MAG: hypothetical protein ACREOO_23725 [bacterium]
MMRKINIRALRAISLLMIAWFSHAGFAQLPMRRDAFWQKYLIPELVPHLKQKCRALCTCFSYLTPRERRKDKNQQADLAALHSGRRG